MIERGAQGWQLILADLALILFLVTLTALVNSSSVERAATADAPFVAPAQALFRPTPRGPTLPEWLAEQPRDPRTTLTIIAKHNAQDRDLMWQNAQVMAASTAGSEVPVRVVITAAQESDLYASLAYDTPSDGD